MPDTTTTTTPPATLPAAPPATRRRYVATVDQLRGRLALLAAERARIPAPLLERWLGGALARVPLYVAAERSIMRAELDGRIDEVRRMLGDGKRGRANNSVTVARERVP